ncbi:MAG: nicotinate phosphoribosyltransferase [Candidatus Nomurabacteria bacterium]|jgi:nicotinamide phosphoribosyltransferase|nr:nicotinate phosphoribosyltransferase [Candidatus Nomurabacteria bacterium]
MLKPKLQRIAFNATDHYKFIHEGQYPKEITKMLVAHTPRKSRIEGCEYAVFFGLQGQLHELHYEWQENFFDLPEDYVISRIKDQIDCTYAKTNPEMAANYDYEHIRALHQLGYLPILVRALPEGTFVPTPYGEDSRFAAEVRVPMFTVENTHRDFWWLPGYLETNLECRIWQPVTVATIATVYRAILDRYAALTSDTPEKVFMQAGDFSMRGMGGPEAAYRCAGGHLLSFGVSSTVEARDYLMQYYDAPPDINAYGPSTEHSVMCAYGRNELTAYRELINRVYPSGNVTIVSDSYDFWGLVANILPAINEEVAKRPGKVSIRPDSGDPVLNLCGSPDSDDPYERKGLVECLYDLGGGHVNLKGYKVLAPYWGATYGDAITMESAEEICRRLMAKGFDTTNVVLGIGSYTYQMVTRDTLGQAYKAVAMIKDGEYVEIYKDPKTDRVAGHNFKKSQRGLLAVVRDHETGMLKCIDQLTPEQYDHYCEFASSNELHTLYVDGEFERLNGFIDMRKRVATETKFWYSQKGARQ